MDRVVTKSAGMECIHSTLATRQLWKSFESPNLLHIGDKCCLCRKGVAGVKDKNKHFCRRTWGGNWSIRHVNMTRGMQRVTLSINQCPIKNTQKLPHPEVAFLVPMDRSKILRAWWKGGTLEMPQFYQPSCDYWPQAVAFPFGAVNSTPKNWRQRVTTVFQAMNPVLQG